MLIFYNHLFFSNTYDNLYWIILFQILIIVLGWQSRHPLNT